MSQTQKLDEYLALPVEVRESLLALSILITRIGTLPKTDRDDLFELLQEWRKADDDDSQRSIHRAMEEILVQVPIAVRPVPLDERKPTPALDQWRGHVGRTIRELRDRAGLTQSDLAGKAGLTQSHISRLENGEHHAANFTLEKIAKALGVTVREIDHCID